MSEADGATEGRRSFARRVAAHTAVRYLFAGGLAFLFDFALLALFIQVFRLPVWIASGIAFLMSFFFTYAIQRVFSFGATNPHGIALLKYAALVAFNTGATIAIVTAIDASMFGWAAGKVVATVATTIWNYFAYRYWVFDERPRGRN